MSLKRIGLLAGSEESFSRAFLARANAEPDVEAEAVWLDTIDEQHVERFDVLVDRASHRVKYYRHYLKAAAAAGAYVINDPFWWSADDKFFGYTLAMRLGVAVPRTVLLPPRGVALAGPPHTRNPQSAAPRVLDWAGIVARVGFPAVLKPADSTSGREIAIARDLAGLRAAYEGSGGAVMVVQEFIPFDGFVRCLCVGQDRSMPLEYEPHAHRYLPHADDAWLAAPLAERLSADARTLNRALGYDLNLVEFALRDGVPYAIDFTNPAPDLEAESIGPRAFDFALAALVALCVEKAGRERTRDAYRWGKLMA